MTEPASSAPVPSEPKPPQGLAKTIIEIVLLAGIVFAAGLMWALTKETKPQVSTTGLADLGSASVTNPSGLRFKDMVVGQGPSPEIGQTVVVHYDGRFPTGEEFDSSRTRGKVFKFKLGQNGIIKGWNEGVATMKVGGVRRLVVPPDLGYGDEGNAGIPPHATLVFDIELLAIE